MNDWGTNLQKDEVAIVVCMALLGLVVWAAIDFMLR